MNYKTYIPTPKLSKYIKYYWSLENEDTSIPISKERIFPDGCIELIFHYGDFFKKYNQDNFAYTQPRSFIHGQIKKYIEIEATGKIGMLSIRFFPNGLQPFLKFDVKELTNQTVQISDFWGQEGNILEDKILHAKTNNNRIQLIESFLLEKLSKTTRKDTFIENSVNSIIYRNTLSIDEQAKNLNVSRRHLERKFVSSVGITPKLFSRIVRFQNALKLIETKNFSSLTMLAYEAGFYDQSHFINDFKEFTGLTPKQYFSENLDLVKFFNLE